MIILLIALMLVVSPGYLLAETEVSGEVSGVWDAEGSPYIVVDSTWVPEGDTLRIEIATDVLFAENQALYVYGIFETYGNDFGDQVTIQVADGVEHWRGLRFYGRNRTVMNYTEIEVPDTAIYLDRGYSLEMNNCRVVAVDQSLRGMEWGGAVQMRSCELTFNDCCMQGGMYWRLLGCAVIANRCEFRFWDGNPSNMVGFGSEYSSFELRHCYIYGGLWNYLSHGTIVENCIFNEVRDIPMYVTIDGPGSRMINTVVEGGCVISNCEEEVLTFHHNTVTGEFGAYQCIPDIFDCDLRGETSIEHCPSATLRNCALSRDIFIYNNRFVNIDSCHFAYHDGTFSDGILFTAEDEDCQLVVTRCLIRTDFRLAPGHTPALFDHNTVILDTNKTDIGILGRYPEELVFTNNIFMATTPHNVFIYYGREKDLPQFRYNCLWNFENFASIGDSIIVAPDSTNIIADPQLEWYGMLPMLLPDSPCIDRGDPDAPLDPDGTRSDIGNRAYYQGCFAPWITDFTEHSFELEARAFPNPFNNILNVSFTSFTDTPLTLTLHDLTGRIVWNGMEYASAMNGGNVTVNANSLPSGRYTFILKSGQDIRAIPVYCLK